MSNPHRDLASQIMMTFFAIVSFVATLICFFDRKPDTTMIVFGIIFSVFTLAFILLAYMYENTPKRSKSISKNAESES